MNHSKSKTRLLSLIIYPSNNFVFVFQIEKAKRPQKVQATQTDGARAVSPATPHKVKSVSQKPKKNVQTESPKSVVR